MTCAQLRTKTRTSVSPKICYVKSGFQILYAVEQCNPRLEKPLKNRERSTLGQKIRS